MTPAEGDTEKLAALAQRGVPGVLEVRTSPGGATEVTFAAEPSADVTSQVHELLAPAPVSIIWYEVSYSAAGESNPLAEAGEQPDGTACGVCRQAPAPWPHSAETPPGAALASAVHWNLCDRCHELLVAGNLDGLAARLVLEDLPDGDLRELVSRLR